MRQVYHPYHAWEDHAAGMWKRTCQPAQIVAALALMERTDVWAAAMREVLAAWPVSCEHNLTNEGQNRLAYLGQASVCYQIGVPACATAAAWWLLSDEQRIRANTAARRAILTWEEGTCRENRLGLMF